MKLFVLLSRFPYPTEKGDKLRAFYQLKELSKHYEIYLCCLSKIKILESEKAELMPYCKQIDIIYLNPITTFFNVLKALYSSKPFQVHYFYQKQAQVKINNLLNTIKPQHIYCQLIRTSEYVKDNFKVNKTIDYMDSFSKSYERLYKFSKLIFKQLYRIESVRLKNYESQIACYFNSKTIISNQDKYYFNSEIQNQLTTVTNGVDNQYFKKVNYEKKYDLGFIGNLSYLPNIKSVEYIIQEIYPILKKQKPTIKILICGAKASKKLLRLNDNNLTIKSWQKDINLQYNLCKVFIAPIMFGSGLQNKILEAMSTEIPCITSNQVANAFENMPVNCIEIAESANEYALKCLQLLKDSNRAAIITKNAKKYVSENHHWGSTQQKLIELIDN